MPDTPQTSSQRIRLLQELSGMSDKLSALNKKTEAAQTAFERTYQQAAATPAKKERLRAKWLLALAALQQAYDESVAFSDENGITRLPVPTGLTQRGARSMSKSAVKLNALSVVARAEWIAQRLILRLKRGADIFDRDYRRERSVLSKMINQALSMPMSAPEGSRRHPANELKEALRILSGMSGGMRPPDMGRAAIEMDRIEAARIWLRSAMDILNKTTVIQRSVTEKTVIKLAKQYGARKAGDEEMVQQYMKLHRQSSQLEQALSGFSPASPKNIRDGDILYHPRYHVIYRVVKAQPGGKFLVRAIESGHSRTQTVMTADRILERQIRRVAPQTAAALIQVRKQKDRLWDAMSTPAHQEIGRLTGMV